MFYHGVIQCPFSLWVPWKQRHAVLDWERYLMKEFYSAAHATVTLPPPLSEFSDLICLFDWLSIRVYLYDVRKKFQAQMPFDFGFDLKRPIAKYLNLQ